MLGKWSVQWQIKFIGDKNKVRQTDKNNFNYSYTSLDSK